MLGDQLEIGRVGSLAGVVQQRGGALMQLTGFKRGQRVVYGRTEKRLGVDEGRVIAQGTFGDLLESSASFKKMVRMIA